MGGIEEKVWQVLMDEAGYLQWHDFIGLDRPYTEKESELCARGYLYGLALGLAGPENNVLARDAATRVWQRWNEVPSEREAVVS
jgi:hypothetical protein